MAYTKNTVTDDAGDVPDSGSERWNGGGGADTSGAPGADEEQNGWGELAGLAEAVADPGFFGCEGGASDGGSFSAAATGGWGVYQEAVARWEEIFGRAAPGPVDAAGRLNPNFVEWMMGFPDGWTEGQPRTVRLKMLGNAVQVQVGQLAGELLLQGEK